MSAKQQSAYGSWVSPITPDLMLSNSVGLGEISRFDNELYWIEMRPEEQGRYVIVKLDQHGQRIDVIPAEFNARTRVHEYGGASYLVCSAGIFFCNFTDQSVYHIDTDGCCHRLTHSSDCRYADLVYDEVRQRLVCIREDHGRADAEAMNTVCAIDIESGAETILVEGADFYSNPRISPDGLRLCWLQWDHPNMPWDTTSLFIAELIGDGSLGKQQRVSTGTNESVCQPRWTRSGNLIYVSDRAGWWNLYSFQLQTLQANCLLTMSAEFAVPQWSFGECSYDFIDEQNLLCIYWQDGLACLGKLDLDSRQLERLDIPFTDLESVVCESGKAWFLAASPTAFPAIIELDIQSGGFKTLRKANELVIDQAYISGGKSISFAIDEEREAHAFFYAPANKEYQGLEQELPPLIVMSHGGPTGASHNGLKMVVQFFTSRGFAVVDVNYSGSSGYGRAYRQRLNGNWGIADVNDCSKAAQYLAAQGLVDNKRLAIRGGSAGGFTTLAALAFTDVFKAGASHYGVSDLQALTEETHKFESRYLDTLIGAYPEKQKLYIERSPINAVDRLSCPVIFFQGLEDRIVPPNQAEKMVAALKEKGIPVAYIAYEGEQHGFRQSQNIKRTLEAELYFYSRIFGFDCADQITPVELN